MAFHYSVRPRYTCGSPAMVGQEIAEMVATQEKDAIGRELEGFSGEECQMRAEVLGLRGIAEKVVERRQGWLVEDLITGEYYDRPFGMDAHLKELGELRVKIRKLRDGTEPVEHEVWREPMAKHLGQFLEAIEGQRFGQAHEMLRFNLPKPTASGRLTDYVREMATKKGRKR